MNTARRIAHPPRMARDTIRAYKAGLRDRVRKLREAKGLTLQEVATALQVELGTYAKYETRSPIPHHLIEPFALLTGTDVHFVVTGRSAAKKSKIAPRRPFPREALSNSRAKAVI